MNRLVKYLLQLSLLQATAISQAATDGQRIAMQGNGQGATACLACHGTDGMGNKKAGYPYLAGMPADYIKNQLIHFKNGNRQNPIMKPIASALTDQDIQAIADYYAAVKNDTLSADKVTTGSSVEGKRIFLSGNWSKGMPACISCHGPQGKGVAPHFPPVVGQPYDYIRSQLMAWKQNRRSGDPVGLMQSVADTLNQDQIDAVAHYLAAQ